MTVFLIAAAIVAILFVKKGFMIVQQGEEMVIERLGSYHRTLKPGPRMIVPFLDKPRKIAMIRYPNGKMRVYETHRIDMRDIILNVPSQKVTTKDNVTIAVSALMYFRIIDSKSAIYRVENLVKAIEGLAQSTLRAEIGKMELDSVFSSREEISQKLEQAIDEAGEKWGVKVTQIAIRDVDIPSIVEDAMTKQMTAERERRATVRAAEGFRDAEIAKAEGEKKAKILEAEGHSQAAIKKAEGERQAAILRAEGEAQAIKNVLESIGNDANAAVQYLIAQRYMETLPNIAKNGERVFLPVETTALIGSIGGVRELLTQTASNK